MPRFTIFVALADWAMMSLLLSRRRRPVDHFNTKELGVLGLQLVPAAELHGVGADEASDGMTAEKAIEHIEADVPPGCTHCDEAMADVGPEREARAAGGRLEFPAHVEAAPVVFKNVGRVGSRHGGFGNAQCRRSYGRELHRGSDCAEVPIGVEGSPLAEMHRVRQRLPDFFRSVAQLADENEFPLFLAVLQPLLLDVRSAGWTRRVLLAIDHRSSPWVSCGPILVACQLGDLN